MSKDSAPLRNLADSRFDARILRAARRRQMAKILVVDDEPLIALTVSDWLTDLGHDVVGPAGDLSDALTLCETPLDAAILDVSLGARTTEAVATRLAERGLPFAVASGHDVGSTPAAFARGLPLPKPFGFETFRQFVERLLSEPT
jgi:CheY-like chemotaxis protein